MAEYIEKAALIKWIESRKRLSKMEMILMIQDAPTAILRDAVRCKDCKQCEMCYPEKLLDKEATQAWLCKKYKRWTKPDDFCSYGERREGE